MNAVILAAGLGSRLKELTEKLPKCLIKVSSQSILEMQLEALFSIPEIETVTIVVGYRFNEIEAFVNKLADRQRIRLVFNHDFATTNNMYSLGLTANEFKGKKFILCNGDVAFAPETVAKFSKENRSEILYAKNSYRKDNMKVLFDESDNLLKISKSLSDSDAVGISMDIYKFSEEDSFRLYEYIENQVKSGCVDRWTEVAIDALCQSGGLQLRGLEIGNDPWFEIDNISDLKAARSVFFDSFTFLGFSNYFFDLDGTLLMEDDPIDGSIALIDMLNSLGKSVFFITNNSGFSDRKHLDRLLQKGFNLDRSQIISSLHQTIRYLSELRIRDVLFLGTESASLDFKESGITFDSNKPKIIVIGNDTEITYKKLEHALTHVYRGVPYLLTHADLSRPTLNGQMPDVGVWGSIVQELTGVLPQRIFGKPDPMILIESPFVSEDPFVSVLNKENSVIIGDRVDTDIKLGLNAGISTVLVLSGATSEATFQDQQTSPTFVINSVKDLLS